MVRRNNLLEATPTTALDGKKGERPNPPPTWIKWIGSGHLLLLIATLIGWQHLSLLWPYSLWPDGIAVGNPVKTQGLLTIGRHGQVARFENSDTLIDDWHKWLHLSDHVDSSTCIAIPAALRRRLSTNAPA